jgi:hypothetical protein
MNGSDGDRQRQDDGCRDGAVGEQAAHAVSKIPK